MKHCPRCGGNKLWHVSTGQVRCGCGGLTRKYAPAPWQAMRISPYWNGGLGEFLCSGVPAYRVEFEVPLNPKMAQRWHGILQKCDLPQQEMEALCALSREIEMNEARKTSLPYSGIL